MEIASQGKLLTMEVWSERCNITDLKVEEKGVNQGMWMVSRSWKGKKRNSPLEFPERNTVLPTA